MSDLSALTASLPQLMARDWPRCVRQLNELKKRPDPAKQAQLAEQMARSQQLCAARAASVPAIIYDDSLPIAAKRDEIKQALLNHQVLVIAGETGSGKTTQLPKICLEAGRGVRGLIGHTQPRRLAARSVAQRVSEELNSPLGQLVGYQVRFEDQCSEQSLIKLMTDGILLAETAQDRFLNRYDTLIIDEAHERSLNIDFLLGYLKNLLPRRPDLKVIITSATIDLERFSRHFNNAPIVEVSGRSYPVEVWYRPLTSELDEEGEALVDDLSVDQGIVAALDEIAAHERAQHKAPGDVLVFLPGEREIRDCAELLRKAQLKHTQVLPLYARLSPAEQQKIFARLPGRKIVLATNVAETSLTVPGIRYVIDSGTARISRYSYRAKVQRLPIEAISQASANQRKGRCGRVEPGICIRLYSEADFLGRPEFTDPEILRTNLAAVILQMLHLKLGRIEDFPFIEPPEGRAISDGLTLLQELRALEGNGQISALGRQLARLPIDPRLGRMVLEAARLGGLEEVLIVVSALSVQDPRERPLDRQQAADQAHAQWKDIDSDFAALINLWRGFEVQRQALGSAALRTWCKKNFLNYLRLREWRDAHRQLLLICRELKLGAASPTAEGKPEQGYALVHQAILAGLLSQIGQKSEEGDYLGARQRRFWLHPATGLGKKRPQWLMAAELVETSKLYARQVARIDPAWLEPLAGHLIKRSYLEPHWEKKRGQVVAYEQLSLYGLIVVGRRPVHYGPIDPVLSRELFIREGLVGGELNSKVRCLSANRALLERLDELEAKARRRDILVDEQRLYEYYEARLPADIYQLVSFERWYKKASSTQPDLLLMSEQDALARNADEVTAGQYPDQLDLGSVQLSLSYHFEPGHERDGVSLSVPAPLLAQLSEARLQWLVPGLLQAKCIALVRGLPKALRKNFVPVPDFVQAALERICFAEGSLFEALGRELTRMTGVRVADEAWQESDTQLEAHFKFNIQVLDAQGKALGEGRDLAQLRSRFAQASQSALALPEAAQAEDKIGAKDFTPLAAQLKQQVAGVSMTVFPGLLEQNGSVVEGRFSTEAEAAYQHRLALQRLLLAQLPEQAKYLRSQWLKHSELGLLYRELGRPETLVEDILLASIDLCVLQDEEVLPREGAALAALAERKRGAWAECAERIGLLTLKILRQQHHLQKRFKGRIDLSWALALGDIKTQLSELVYPGFVRHTPSAWLKELPRYLHAMELRLDKLPSQVQRDRVWTAELVEWRSRYQEKSTRWASAGRRDEALEQFRWMLEEYRVSLFAQQLGTLMPVSDKRLAKYWAQLAD